MIAPASPNFNHHGISDKIKKRTPGRSMKLVGDLYLLVGRTDLALKFYTNAIDATKSASDFQWQASAIEGLICTQMITALKKVDPTTEFGEGIGTFNVGFATSLMILKLAKIMPDLQTLIVELPERYREVIGLYDRAIEVGDCNGFAILQHEACFKVCDLLSAAFKLNVRLFFAGGPYIQVFHSESKNIGAELISAARNASQQASKLDVDSESSGASILECWSWVLRAHSSGSWSDAPLKYQVQCLAKIAALALKLGMMRKYAFFLRLAGISIHALDPMSQSAVSCLMKSHDVIRSGWESLNLTILNESMRVSESTGDHESTFKIAKMLLQMHPLTTSTVQMQTSAILQKVKVFLAPHQKRSSGSLEIKFLNSITMMPYLDSNIRTATPLNTIMKSPGDVKPADREIFLYNPYQKQRANAASHLVCNDIFSVNVSLNNPFKFDLEVNRIYLQ